MDKNLTILLIEDDTQQCFEFEQYIETVKNAVLVASTNSSSKGIQLVNDFMPDVVILDLELNKGFGNGFFFLKELKNLNLIKRPYILVTTNIISETTLKQARNMGADFIISKHQKDYSVKSVIDFLLIMQESIHNNDLNNKNESNKLSEDTPDQINKRIKSRIQRELELVGINPKFLGRNYLIDSIFLLINNQQCNISSELAKKYNKTSASVTRAMQTAIEHAWQSTCIDDLSRNYTAIIRSDKGVPTLMEFLHFYAEKINELFPQK